MTSRPLPTKSWRNSRNCLTEVVETAIPGEQRPVEPRKLLQLVRGGAGNWVVDFGSEGVGQSSKVVVKRPPPLRKWWDGCSTTNPPQRTHSLYGRSEYLASLSF